MQQLLKYLLILSGLLASSGCSLLQTQEKFVVKSEYIQQKIPIKPRPNAIKLNSIKFRVITEENLQEYLKEFSDTSVVFFALSVQDYETLALNMSEIRRYIEQQKAVIVYYENSLTNPKEGVDETK
jgi:hypothetical protein